MGIEVKLNEIIEAIEMQFNDSSAYIEKKTGQVHHLGSEEFTAADDNEPIEDFPDWQQDSIKLAKQILEHPDDYIELPDKFELNEYNIMRDFCDSIEDQTISAKLSRSIHGSGAFARFKQAVHLLDIADEWYAFRNDAIKNFAIDWCQSNDITYKE